ncbi:MAG TPA: protein phosphatase 2C domain-containing protein [Anaerolineae bacterium]|nr:protein phosphatase 2C domain-containing protein [Anaerolineae bacterium]
MQLSGWSQQGHLRAANGDAWGAHVPPEPDRLARQGALLAIAEGYGADGREIPWLGSQVLQALGRRFYAGDGDRAAQLLAGAQEANRLVLGRRRQPGLTGSFAGLVAAVATPGEAVLAQVGDGQAFLLRNRLVSPVFPWPRPMNAGEPLCRPGPRRLDVALGGQLSVPVRLSRFGLQPGDQLLLCSGGFSAELPAWPGWAALPDPAEIVRAVDDGGGRQNRTVVMLRVPEPPHPSPPPSPGLFSVSTARPAVSGAGPDWQPVFEVLGPVAVALALAAMAMAAMSR